MRPNTANIAIRVEPQLVEKIDGWRGRQRVSLSRAAAIIHMIEYFLEQETAPSNPAWRKLLSKA